MNEPLIVGVSSLARELVLRSGEVVGALGQGGLALLPDQGAVSLDELQRLLAHAERKLGEQPVPPVAGRTVVLVDDGPHASQTVVVAVAALRELGAGRVVLAAAPQALLALQEVVDGLMELSPDWPASLAALTASETSPRT